MQDVHAQGDVGEIGKVTIDGEEIPEVLYTAFANRHMLDNSMICPPVSDAFMRDSVIAIWLRDLDMRKRDMLTPEIRKSLREIRKISERNRESLPDVAAGADLWLKEIVSDAMRDETKQAITPERVAEHYQRLVDQKDPRLVDVILIKQRTLPLWSAEEIKIATDMIADGKGISEISEVAGDKDFNVPLRDEWINLEFFIYAPEDLNELKPGALLGPIELFNRSLLISILDVKKIPQLLPGTRVNLDSDFVMNYAEKSLKFQDNFGLDDEVTNELWSKYSVMLDGKPLDKPTSYPTCAR